MATSGKDRACALATAEAGHCLSQHGTTALVQTVEALAIQGRPTFGPKLASPNRRESKGQSNPESKNIQRNKTQKAGPKDPPLRL